MDSLEKLQDAALPPYEAFFSTLKNSNTLEEGKVRYGTEHEKSMKKIKMKLIMWNVITFMGCEITKGSSPHCMAHYPE